MLFLLLHTVFLMSIYHDASYEIHALYRSSCRRDVLFKLTDRTVRITGTSNAILLSVASRSLCARKCIEMLACMSIGYKSTANFNGDKNCELLDIDKSNVSALVTHAIGWDYYEPVEQVGPRCKLVACNVGYLCRENCAILAGYQCIEINECESIPCQNSGTCINQINQYTCQCVAGYSGTNCETNINECQSAPCQNSGTCVDEVNKYTCQCVAGYSGTNCQTNINECQSAPCQNSGTCVDEVNKYTCQCVAGYSGTNCQTNINECQSAPCQNSGTCVDEVNKYTCQCVAGYGGANCVPISSVTFTNAGYTGRVGIIQQHTILATGNYRIEAGGAKGGVHISNYGSYPGTFSGGNGAKVQGDFWLTAGLTLNIVVGHGGGNSVEVKGGQRTTATAASLGLSVEDNAGTGGGGGTFVYSTESTLYVVAGGGGGATAGWNGVNGQADTSGGAAVGKASTLGAGGTAGKPGQCCNTGSFHGGVGAGWTGQGLNRAGSSHGERGGGLAQNWIGGNAGIMNSGNNGGPAPGAVGGFGGGGGGSEDNGASGGGGGYSGGGSGSHSNAAGGGGGSYCGGLNCVKTTGGSAGINGYVKITPL